MSIKVMSYYWEEALDIRGNDLLAMLALADHSNDEGVCWPGIARLGRKLRCTDRSVQIVLTELEKGGHIRRYLNAGSGPVGRRTNAYAMLAYRRSVGITDDSPPSIPAYAKGVKKPSSLPATGEETFTPRVKKPSPHGGRNLHPTGEETFTPRVKKPSPKPSLQPSTEPSTEPSNNDRPLTANATSSSDTSWESLELEYGQDLLRQAINTAPEVKRMNMKYIAGILRNWRSEGTDRRITSRRSDPYAR